MSEAKFILVRETPKTKLPGVPVAVVRSNDPALDQLVLCTVNGYTNEDEDSDSDSDSEEKKSHSTLQTRLAGSKRGRKDADIEEVLSEVPHASVEAAKAASDFEKHGDSKGGALKFNKAATKAISNKADFVKLPIGSHFEPLPSVDPSWRTTGYVAGKSGSGKSVFTAGIIRRWKKLFPDRPVYGVCKSKLSEDPAYADLKISQLPISAFMTEVNLEKFFGKTGCFVLFDDWDSLEPEEIKAVQACIQDVLNLGRKLHISCYITSHLLTNYNQTRGIIHEADAITLFPQTCMYQSLYYLCSRLGMEKDVIKRLKAKGRWVLLHNSSPIYLLSETEAEML